MPTLRRSFQPLSAWLIAALLAPASAQSPAPPPPASPGSVVAELALEAEAMARVVGSPTSRLFLAAAKGLPPIRPRAVLRDEKTREAFTDAQADALPEDRRAALKPLTLDERFYYLTRYGTPMAYARAIDLAAEQGFQPAGSRILDFGYGGVGHLRMLASIGAACVGVDVDPLLPALYGERGDTGEIPRLDPDADHPEGSITLLNGRWPADESVRAAAGSGFSLILSKNTLKNGYINPPKDRAVDERRLIKLGVSNDAFIAAAFEALKPGGLLLIYNLSPAQAPPDKEYIPWAYGTCPFPREALERAGFEVIAFDANDDAPARQMAEALGWTKPNDDGSPGMDAERDLFGRYTIARRPGAEAR